MPAGLPPAPFLYPLIDVGVCRAGGIDPAAAAEACLSGGARMLQVRFKEGSGAAFLALAETVVQTATRYDAGVIVNDRADIARLAGAAGVHVGQEDMDVDDVWKVVGGAAIVGVSTHCEKQIDAAIAGTATYVAVGPIFGTATKETGYSARGLDLVRYAAGRGKPIVAIGGITLDRVEQVVDAGAAGAAVIADLLAGGNPEERTREFVARLRRRS